VYTFRPPKVHKVTPPLTVSNIWPQQVTNLNRPGEPYSDVIGETHSDVDKCALEGSQSESIVSGQKGMSPLVNFK